MSNQMIQALAYAVENKMLTMTQAFEYRLKTRVKTYVSMIDEQ